MNEKQTNMFRLILKVLGAAAGLFALIGSIGLLASLGKLTGTFSSLASSGSSSSLSSLSALTSQKDIYPMLDLARFGGFAVFLVAVIYMTVEFIGQSRGKKFSMLMAASSLLGFIGCFLSSISTMYSSAMSAVTSMAGSILSGGSSETMVLQLLNKMFVPMKVGAVFILISSALVIIFVIVSMIKPKSAKGYTMAGYGQAAQPYAAQQYPNQPYPNQQYPNQPYLNQQYPYQAFPGQQYTGQSFAGQAPSNDQFNNQNNFTPQ